MKGLSYKEKQLLAGTPDAGALRSHIAYLDRQTRVWAISLSLLAILYVVLVVIKGWTTVTDQVLVVAQLIWLLACAVGMGYLLAGQRSKRKHFAELLAQREDKTEHPA